jgi:hypothetical protein
MANKTICWFKKQLNSPNLKHQTKRVLYKTLIRPILTMKLNVGPSQIMKKCSEFLKEEY